VKNTFLPCLARLRICCCSSESVTLVVDLHDEDSASSGLLGNGMKSSVNGSTSGDKLGLRLGLGGRGDD
jgi:hypothetical protein